MITLIFGGEGQEKIIVPLSLAEAQKVHAHLSKRLTELSPDRMNPAHAALAVERAREKGGH